MLLLRPTLVGICLLAAWGCDARVGRAQCSGAPTDTEVADASERLGVDPESTRAELFSITSLTWSTPDGLTAALDWSIASPQAVTFPDSQAGCEPTPLIWSQVELALSTPGVLSAQLKGQVTYADAEGALRLQGDVVAEDGFGAALSRSTYAPDDYGWFDLRLEGGVDGGSLALDGGAGAGAGKDVLVIEAWVPGAE